jgi:AcrR family transcriptional regulator
LEAARAVFSERGPDARMEEVAERAGVGVGTLYRNFPDKGALLGELVAQSLLTIAGAARDALAVVDTWGAFEGVVRLLVQMGSEDRSFARAAPWGETGGALAQAREELQRSMEELIRRAQEAGALRPDVGDEDLFVLFGGVINAPPHVSTESRERCVSIILDGLRRRAGHRTAAG